MTCVASTHPCPSTGWRSEHARLAQHPPAGLDAAHPFSGIPARRAAPRPRSALNTPLYQRHGSARPAERTPRPPHRGLRPLHCRRRLSSPLSCLSWSITPLRRTARVARRIGQGDLHHASSGDPTTISAPSRPRSIASPSAFATCARPNPAASQMEFQLTDAVVQLDLRADHRHRRQRPGPQAQPGRH